MATYQPTWPRLLLTIALLLSTVLPDLAPAPATSASASALPSAAPFTSPLPPPSPAARLALTLHVAPAWAEPGEVVMFTVTAANTGAEPLASLILTDTLPDGLIYVARSAVGFEYSTNQKRLTWQPPLLAAGATITGSFQAWAQGLALGATVTNTVLAIGAGLVDPVSASTAVDIVVPRADEAWVTPGAGGLLRSSDDRVLLRVPPGAVKGRTRFSYRPQADAPNPPSGLRFAFSLEARGEQGQAVRQFPTPLALTVAFAASEVVIPGLVYYDEVTQQWAEIPTQRVPGRPQLYARLGHLTLFGLTSTGPLLEMEPAAQIRGAQPALYSRSIVYQYPFDLPPGRGGFTPKLALIYSSASHSLDAGHFSPAGHGWELLGADYVERRRNANASHGYDVVLHLPGQTFTLVSPTSGSPSGFTDNAVWYAKEAPTLKVRYETTTSPNYRIFKVWTADGALYQFQGNVDISNDSLNGAPPGQTGAYPPATNQWREDSTEVYCAGAGDVEWVRLPLHAATDARGNVVHYDWTPEISHEQGAYGADDQKQYRESCWYIRALRLKKISYNGTPGQGAPSDRVQISFDYGSADERKDRPAYFDDKEICDPPGSSVCRSIYSFFSIYRLKSATVSVSLSLTSAVTTTIFALSHAGQTTESPSQQLLRLNTITEQGGGLARSANFSYADAGMTEPTHYGYLQQVANAIGGSVVFTATTGASGTTGLPAVLARSEVDVVTGQSATWTYGGANWSDDARGFQRVWVVQPDGATAVHTYVQGPCVNQTNDPHAYCPQAGRETRTRLCASYTDGTDTCGNQQLAQLQWVETDYISTTFPSGVSWAEFDRPYFVYASEQRAYATQFADNGTAITSDVPVKRTTYEYQPDRQGNAQYGNLTRVTEYNGHNGGFSAGPFRTTSAWYYPNASAWIIDKPALTKVYTDPEVTLFAETRNYYDNTTNYGVAPTAGLLRRGETMSVLNGSYQSNPASTSQYYEYENGNLKRVLDANNHETKYFYDTWFQAFRVCEQNAAGHQIKTTYYGVPGVGAGECITTNGSTSNLAGRFGLPEKTVDANGALTEYAYDGLGRPLKVAIAPNTFASNTPTWWYHYGPLNAAAYGQPYWVHSLQRDEQAANNNYLHTWTFYDGFGRVLQTQAEADNARHVETSYTYTWRDAVARASLPRFVEGEVAKHPDSGGPPWPSYVALNETAWAGLTKTVYTYDALGRLTQTTHPDTTTTRQYYNIGFDEGYNTTRRLAAVIDARNVQTIRADDAFGRLSRSKEFSATNYTTPRWGDTPYAVAIYRYNIGDQLTDAYDPANNRIQVFYDGLGRKSAMTDPDLGAWSYTYDAAGNLQTQTDARSTTLWFGYDTLNRLTQKRLSNSGGTLLAEYKYDESGYGYSAGRRTRAIAYGGGAPNNTIQWTYDARGRVISDIRTIDSVNYTTGYTYDAADRVRTTTYPESSEVVTTTYTAQGLPYSLISPQATYVFSTTYDALGRSELRAYQSAALQSDYVYYAWNAGAGYGGRLQSLKSGVGSGATGLQNLTYAYDATGNLTRLRDDNNSGQRQCFSYDPLGRLSRALIGDANCAATTGGNGYYPLEDYAYTANGSLTSKAGLSYTYPASTPTGCAANTPTTKPHAAAAAGGYSFTYDCSGNQLTRPEPTGTYTQAYDGENRLSTVTVSGQTTTYTYDADGALVKKVQGGQTTVYVGQHFEKNQTSGQATSYYFLGGQRVAMRKAGTLYYLLSDHLGSTSVVTNQSGGVVAQQLYKPWGESRWINGTLPTDRKFTGQRSEEATLGSLYDFQARAYSPRLGRFLSPDTIVPSPGDPQSLNRYSYTLNNPLKYTDPTGHFPYTPLPFPDFWLPQAGQALNQLWMRAQPYAYQLATDLSQFASSSLAQLASQQAQITDAAAKQAQQGGGDTMGPGGSPNGPFKDLPERVQRGVQRLRQAANNPIQRFALGYRAQLARAEYWAGQGQLAGVEETGPGGVRYDLVLRGENSIVEVKYWTRDFVFNQGGRDLLRQQLGKYQAQGKQIILEMFQTRTNALTLRDWEDVRSWLVSQGVQLSDLSQLLPPLQ